MAENYASSLENNFFPLHVVLFCNCKIRLPGKTLVKKPFLFHVFPPQQHLKCCVAMSNCAETAEAVWSGKAVSRRGGGGWLQESSSCQCFVFSFPVGFSFSILSFCPCFLRHCLLQSHQGGGQELLCLCVQPAPTRGCVNGKSHLFVFPELGRPHGYSSAEAVAGGAEQI